MEQMLAWRLSDPRPQLEIFKTDAATALLALRVPLNRPILDYRDFEFKEPQPSIHSFSLKLSSLLLNRYLNVSIAGNLALRRQRESAEAAHSSLLAESKNHSHKAGETSNNQDNGSKDSRLHRCIC
jgi:hypothetical protein